VLSLLLIYGLANHHTIEYNWVGRPWKRIASHTPRRVVNCRIFRRLPLPYIYNSQQRCRPVWHMACTSKSHALRQDDWPFRRDESAEAMPRRHGRRRHRWRKHDTDSIREHADCVWRGAVTQEVIGRLAGARGAWLGIATYRRHRACYDRLSKMSSTSSVERPPPLGLPVGVSSSRPLHGRFLATADGPASSFNEHTSHIEHLNTTSGRDWKEMERASHTGRRAYMCHFFETNSRMFVCLCVCVWKRERERERERESVLTSEHAGGPIIDVWSSEQRYSYRADLRVSPISQIIPLHDPYPHTSHWLSGIGIAALDSGTVLNYPSLVWLCIELVCFSDAINSSRTLNCAFCYIVAKYRPKWCLHNFIWPCCGQVLVDRGGCSSGSSSLHQTVRLFRARMVFHAGRDAATVQAHPTAIGNRNVSTVKLLTILSRADLWCIYENSWRNDIKMLHCYYYY